MNVRPLTSSKSDTLSWSNGNIDQVGCSGLRCGFRCRCRFVMARGNNDVKKMDYGSSETKGLGDIIG